MNVPLVFVKNSGAHEIYFAILSTFVLAFIGSFIFYLTSQKDIRPDWRKKIVLFPLFMAGSMGLAVNNSRAVIEGLLGRRSEFVRTPKFNKIDKTDQIKANKYISRKLEPGVIVELVMAVYCFVGVLSSIYFLEIATLPFQLLFFLGFAFMSGSSIRHAYSKK